MEIYCIIFIILLINALLFENDKLLFGFTIFFFAVFIGFRALSVGADTRAYLMIFLSNGNNGYHGYPEPLYGLLCRFFYLLGFSFSGFQTILSLIMLSLGGYTIHKHSPNILFSLFCLFGMYFICYAMNINRQAEACFLILFGYHFLLEKRYIIFIVIIIISMGIHTASAIALIAIVAHKIPLNHVYVFIGLFFSFLIGLYFNESIVSGLLGGYARYLQDNVGSGLRTMERLSDAIMLVTYWMIGFVFFWTTAKDELKNSFFMKMYFITIMINNATIRLELGIRVVLLFSILQVILYPLYAESSIFTKSISTFFVVCYISIFFIVFISSGSAAVVPYKLF
ncbi:EpsG family protein [Phocaeicola sartorii]|jgi:hypothetical protein|uniref:EpsG family protein n=1 Tax=Phocaeicola sartorii TaxID=671267 RepID=UPI0026709D4B|nr:EpsG family protein [Phocaeicola sartorii]